MDPSHDQQRPFSKIHPEAAFNCKIKARKAATIFQVLRDYPGDELWSCSFLDVGCSNGIIANLLATCAGEVVGIDRDRPVIELLI